MGKPLTTEDVLAQEPRHIGEVSLSVLPARPIHWIAPWPGSEKDMSESLHRQLGVRFPAPGEIVQARDTVLVWAGRSAAVLMNVLPPEPLSAHGAVIDISDGWVGFALAGTTAADVMARVCPVDLRPDRYNGQRALRTEIAHVAGLVVAGHSEIDIWVMRSFACSVYEELLHASEAVAARATLTS